MTLYTGVVTSTGNLIGFFSGRKIATPALREFTGATAYLRAMALPAAGFLDLYLTATFLFALCYWGAWTLDGAAFSHPEDSAMSFGDFFYFSIVTITTVGYGDVTPKTNLSKLLVGAETLASVGLITVVFPAVLAYLQSRFNEISNRLREHEGETPRA